MGYDPRITSVIDFPYRRTTVPRVGDWFGGSDAVVSASVTPAEAVVSFAPLLIPTQMTLDKIGAAVTGAGAAGAVVRSGIVSSDANGLPYTLILDAGTQDASATFPVPLTISQALAPGLYWYALVVQGAAASRPTVRTTSHGFAVAALLQATITGASIVPQISGVTGAFPTGAGAMAPTAFSAGAIAPLPQLHRSA